MAQWLRVALCEGLRDPDADELPLGVRLAVPDAVRVREAVDVLAALPVPDGVGDGVREQDAVRDGGGDAVAEGVGEVREGLRETEHRAVRVREQDRVEGVRDAVGVPDRVSVDEEVVLGARVQEREGVREGVWERERDWEREAVRVASEVEVGDAVSDGEAEREALLEPVAVAEAEAVVGDAV